MGGEGPYIDFDPDNVGKWSAHTGIKPLSQYELEAMWERAAPLLQEIVVNPLVKDYGWSVIDGHAVRKAFSTITTEETPGEHGNIGSEKESGQLPKGITLQGDITKKYWDKSRTTKQTLTLPSSMASFLDRNQTTLWTKQFGYFDAKRINRNSNTMYIDSIPPLSNYIYLIQCLVPGIITLVRMDEIDDYGEITTARGFPDPSWISEHRTAVQSILGGSEKYEQLYQVAQTKSFIETSDPYHEYYDSEPMGDFTACGQDCGYCGTCDY